MDAVDDPRRVSLSRVPGGSGEWNELEGEQWGAYVGSGGSERLMRIAGDRLARHRG